MIFGLYLALIGPASYAMDKMFKNTSVTTNGQPNIADMLLQGFSVFKFPYVWHNMAYLMGWFQLILAVIVITLVTNEYSFKTLRQNIIDGMSKWEVIIAKEIIILLLTLTSVLVLIAVTIFLGEKVEGVALTDGTQVILAYFISTFFYLNLAYFLSSILKRSGLTIGLLLIYSVVELIVGSQIPQNFSNYLPLKLLGKMIPNPMGILMGNDISPDLSLTTIGALLIYLVLIIYGIYYLLKKGHAAK
jgi:ABC-2 type transport system permease protein